jgi:hypothetical protein
MYDYQSIDALVSGVKGTTSFLSRLISRKTGFTFLFIIFALIVSTIILN